MTAHARVEEQVILVDPDNQPLGWLEKLRAHREGALHRAFSVFIVDAAGALLLQRRALAKYHSGGRWSNTCCGHPRPGEDTTAAAARRLGEEMGFRCDLQPVFAFRYRTRVGPDLVEHEHDTVYVGRYDGAPEPDPAEVAEWRHVPLARLPGEVRRAPHRYTVWLRLILRQRGGDLLRAIQRLRDRPGHP